MQSRHGTGLQSSAQPTEFITMGFFMQCMVKRLKATQELAGTSPTSFLVHFSGSVPLDHPTF